LPVDAAIARLDHRSVLTKLASGVAIAAVGCSSGYIPRTPGRVAIVMDAGKIAYVRDGRSYPHGLLGGGLEDAVAGNPGAETAAHEYRSRLGTGLLVGVLGLTCMTVALSLSIGKLADEEAPNPRTEGWVSLGCAVASIAGFGYAITAEPYRWDAINIFNDTQPSAPYPGLPGPPGATRRMSMQMSR
jgi:hypothetical protein